MNFINPQSLYHFINWMTRLAILSFELATLDVIVAFLLLGVASILKRL